MTNKEQTGCDGTVLLGPIDNSRDRSVYKRSKCTFKNTFAYNGPAFIHVVTKKAFSNTLTSFL